MQTQRVKSQWTALFDHVVLLLIAYGLAISSVQAAELLDPQTQSFIRSIYRS